MRVMLWFLLSLLASLQDAQAANVLVIGDSMSEYAGKSLESFCRGTQVRNAAVGGTTAAQWATQSWLLDRIGSEQCGGEPDFIWLTVGGNDFLQTDCRASSDEIAAQITASIQAVKQRAPNAPIVMTGYCMPQGMENRQSNCNSPQKFHGLMNAIRQAAAADESVIYVESVDACNGTMDSWSSGEYFFDPIHLNNRGYCKVFSQPAFQALGCEPAEYDCDAVPCETPGLDQHCDQGTIDSCYGCCGFVSAGGQKRISFLSRGAAKRGAVRSGL